MKPSRHTMKIAVCIGGNFITWASGICGLAAYSFIDTGHGTPIIWVIGILSAVAPMMVIAASILTWQNDGGTPERKSTRERHEISHKIRKSFNTRRRG